MISRSAGFRVLLATCAILSSPVPGLAQQPATAVPAPGTVPSPADATSAAAAQQAQDVQEKNSSKSIFPITGVPATYPNAVFAAIKYGALDMTSDDAIDDFAKVEYCDIYKQYNANEFDWRRVRAAMRKKIELDKPTYPDTLYLERQETFGKYDFSSGMLSLDANSMLHTRALRLAASDPTSSCNTSLKVFPSTLVVLLDKPIILDGIELSEDEAQSVIAGMDVSMVHPELRLAYGRYTITLTGVEQSQGQQVPKLDAKLDNVTMYLDRDYSRPFWSGQSSQKIYHQQQGQLDAIPFRGIDTTQQAVQKPVPNTVLPTR